jgi:phage repressor protein C with HTH and peptisase S24 domain
MNKGQAYMQRSEFDFFIYANGQQQRIDMKDKNNNSDHSTEPGSGDPSLSLEVGSRIDEVCKSLGDRKVAASAAGLSTDQLGRYIAGTSPRLGFFPIAKLCDAAGYRLEWVWTGAGPARRADERAPELQLQLDEGIGVEFSLVPQYAVEASAGPGRVVERESEVGKLAFRRDWIRQKGLSTKDLVVIRVVGDSMSPTIRDGALVLVDTSQEHAKADGIYVIMVDGHLMAKRLQPDLAGGGLYIRSDNPAYREQHLTADQAADFRVIGRVVWAGGEV